MAPFAPRYGMRILGIGAHVPPDIWSNERVAARLEEECASWRSAKMAATGLDLTPEEVDQCRTNNKWISRFIGFSSRRYVLPGQGTIDLAVPAAERALAAAGLKATDLDGIRFCTVTPSYRNSPPDSTLLQHRLGIPAMDGRIPREFSVADISLACCSFAVGLRQAYSDIASGLCQKLMVVGADAMSTTINWRDRAFATVLGDAGTAVIVDRVTLENDQFGPQRFWSFARGECGETIITPAGGSRVPLTPEGVQSYQHCLTMDGRRVKEDMVPFIGGPAIEAALAKAGWTLADVDIATLHEANLALNRGIVEEWRSKGFRGLVLDAGGRYANTTSASVLLAAAANARELRAGRKWMIVVFGGGYTAVIACIQLTHDIPVIHNLEMAA